MFKLYVALALVIPNVAYSYQCNEELDVLSNKYNINIICKTSSTKKTEEIRYEDADQKMIDDAAPSIVKFFHSYNREFIVDKIEKIMLFKNIIYLDSSVGGLSDGNIIWLSLMQKRKEYLDKAYFQILNHEFSSNVYKKLSFNKQVAWKNISYLYEYSIYYIRKCINNPSFAFSSTEEGLSQGFITNYALTNDENDFNVYAETLFTEPEKLKRLKNIYPNIKIKLGKLKEYYRELGFKGKFPDET